MKAVSRNIEPRVRGHRSGGRQVTERAPVRRAAGHVIGGWLEVTAVIEGETVDADHSHFLQNRPDSSAAGRAEVA